MHDKRLPGVVRGVSPCTDCTERFEACWGNCPKDSRGEYGYKAWKADIQEIKDKMKAHESLNRRKKWRRKIF